MALNQRIVTNCPFREPCSPSETNNQSDGAICDLLVQISGIKDRQLATVATDACEACCKMFLPSIRDWNGTIPSLVVDLCSKVIAAGGVSGCSVQEAKRLRQESLNRLPLILPSESVVVPMPSAAPALRQPSCTDIAEVMPLPGHKMTPSTTYGKRKVHWAVGVTTHQRRICTLEETLKALVCAGWQEYRVFVDGSSDMSDYVLNSSQWPGDFGITTRDTAIGAWSNWLLALVELYQRSPKADAYLVLQDDALLARLSNLREYVDEVIMSLPEDVMLSLYSSSHDSQASNGWNNYSEIWKIGALAFVFRPQSLQKLVGDAQIWNLHRQDDESAQRGIDPKIGSWAHANGVPVWHPTPSLVQHIGDVSAIWKHARAVGRRRASLFLESWFDGR